MFENRTYCEGKRSELSHILIPSVYHYNPPKWGNETANLNLMQGTHVEIQTGMLSHCQGPPGGPCSVSSWRAPLRTQPSAGSWWPDRPPQASCATPNCKSASATQVWMCKPWIDWMKLFFWQFTWLKWHNCKHHKKNDRPRLAKCRQEAGWWSLDGTKHPGSPTWTLGGGWPKW